MAPVLSPVLALPEDQWFHNGDTKTGICLHHTVGGTAPSSVQWWCNDNQMVGTAYIIERDGTIFEVFNPKGWAYQFGLKWPDKISFEKRFIGIEIASEGALRESDGKFYCFDRITSRTEKNPAEVFDYGKPYRGYRYFDKYEKAQVDSVIELVNHLLQTFNIERKIPSNYMDYYGPKLKHFNGVIGHVNVREDKTDPLPDDNFWKRVINECHLQVTQIEQAVAHPLPHSEDGLSTDEINSLFQDNLAQFSIMNRAAGNMVKGLLWELQDSGRNTYIRLRNAQPNGHIVFYDLVQGNPGLVPLAAQSLGFKSWNLNKLEVHNA
ncbi:MAG: N-acetylmuramoyl-L-alanine amidase [Ignavibacteriales bacterium]|nr:MAG: N-acetylmuramoyl-L-alanine amidase [Ignavibacteriales bacterium]